MGPGLEVEEPQGRRLYSRERVAPGEVEGVAIDNLSVIDGVDVP